MSVYCHGAMVSDRDGTSRYGWGGADRWWLRAG